MSGCSRGSLQGTIVGLSQLPCLGQVLERLHAHSVVGKVGEIFMTAKLAMCGGCRRHERFREGVGGVEG